jgi:hypothetical protein
MLPEGTVARPSPGVSQLNLFLAPFPRTTTDFQSYQLQVTSEDEIVYYDHLYGFYQYWVPVDALEILTRFSPGAGNGYQVYDTTLTKLEVVRAGNGYGNMTDSHGLQFLENGHVLVFALHDMEYDLSQIIPGGSPEVNVRGMVIQELDAPDMSGERRVITHWSSHDHPDALPVTDAVVGVDYTTEFIDFTHANSVDLDDDGNIIVSARNLSQIFKVSWPDGEVLWRMGAAGKNNDFEFINDPVPFTAQHYAHRLNNGNILLFDNGAYRENPYARAVEYSVDEDSRTATLVWSFDHGKTFASTWRGSAQRLENGNTLITWGSVAGGTPQVTEVDSNGTVVYELNFGTWPGSDFSTTHYQAHRSRLNIVAAQPSIISEGDAIQTLKLLFAKFGDASVQGYRVYVDEFTPPVTLWQETGETSLSIGPEWPFEATRVYVNVTAVHDDGSESVPSETIVLDYSELGTAVPLPQSLPHNWAVIQSWPNPFNAQATVSVQLANPGRIKAELVNILGRNVMTLAGGYFKAGHHLLSVDGQRLASGVYLVRVLREGQSPVVRRLLLIR